jgi:electron transport complex protein RnfG
MSQTKAKVQFDGKYIAKLAITLLVITAVAALLLGVVYSMTKPTIDARAEQTKRESMTAVMSNATEFSEVAYTEQDGILDVNAAYNGTELVGYCVQVGPSGFGGTIEMMVGVSVDGSVTGVSILSHSETSGLGTKAMTEEFLSQYVGATGQLTVKTGASTDIDHISGATVSSRGITSGVNMALAFIAEGGVTE